MYSAMNYRMIAKETFKNVRINYIAECDESEAEFISIQRDNNKTVLNFHINRGVDGEVNKLYPHAGPMLPLLFANEH